MSRCVGGFHNLTSFSVALLTILRDENVEKTSSGKIENPISRGEKMEMKVE